MIHFFFVNLHNNTSFETCYHIAVHFAMQMYCKMHYTM